MWRVRNESTGKEVLYYEAKLIDALKAECYKPLTIYWNKNYQTDSERFIIGASSLAINVLKIIEQYEKEG